MLAHEINHVSQHHIARRIAAQSGADAVDGRDGRRHPAAGTGNGQTAMAAATSATAAQQQV